MSILASEDFRSKIYDYMVNRDFHGASVIGDFVTAALGIINEYSREIYILEKFGHTPDEVAEYLCRYFRLKLPRSSNFIKEVNNDVNGWKEIISIKETYKYHGKGIRLRGRGKNRKARMEAAGLYFNNTHDLSYKIADRIAIYER